MKRLFFILSALCTFSISSNAQQIVNTNQLDGTEWVEIDTNNNELGNTLKFTTTSMKSTLYDNYTKKDILKTYAYYLSSSTTDKFVSSNVGKNTSGSYIINYSYRTKRTINYQVLSLTSTTLKLHYKPSKSIIGDPDGYVFIYKRIR